MPVHDDCTCKTTVNCMHANSRGRGKWRQAAAARAAAAGAGGALTSNSYWLSVSVTVITLSVPVSAVSVTKLQYPRLPAANGPTVDAAATPPTPTGCRRARSAYGKGPEGRTAN